MCSTSCLWKWLRIIDVGWGWGQSSVEANQILACQNYSRKYLWRSDEQVCPHTCGHIVHIVGKSKPEDAEGSLKVHLRNLKATVNWITGKAKCFDKKVKVTWCSEWGMEPASVLMYWNEQKPRAVWRIKTNKRMLWKIICSTVTCSSTCVPPAYPYWSRFALCELYSASPIYKPSLRSPWRVSSLAPPWISWIIRVRQKERVKGQEMLSLGRTKKGRKFP